MEIDWDDHRDPSNDRVATSETATISSTIPDCDDPFRIRDGIIGSLKRFAHVLCYRSGYHQDIGMTRRRNKPETEALDVVISIVQRVNFEFASVARPGINFAYRKATSEAPTCGSAYGYCQFSHRGIV